MKLSFTAILVYVLHSGCVGRLNMGHIERDGKGGVNVFGPERTINEYISGTNLRSWCVVGMDRRPITGWCSVLPEDRSLILTAGMAF